MDTSHDRTASDKTVQQMAVTEEDDLQDMPAPSPSSFSSDVATPTPTASTIFLGQQTQRLSDNAASSASTTRGTSSSRANVPSTTAAATASGAPTNTSSIISNNSTLHVSAVPMSGSSSQSSIQIPAPHSTIPTPLASPAFAQAALGRGRAPTLQSHPSGSIGSGSPVSKTSTTGLPYAQRQNMMGGQGKGSGHRSNPSTSASIAFSDAPTSANYGGGGNNNAGGGNLTETESVFSGGEEDVYQQSTRKGRTTTGQTTTSSRASRPGGSLRPTSAVGSKGKGRTRSRSNIRRAESDIDSDDDVDKITPSKTPEDTVTLLPPGHRVSNLGLADDEVPRRDRGEELVRLRMRERRREKKDAERRERKKREEEQMRRDQGRTNARAQKTAGGQRESFTSESQPGTSYQDRPTFSRRSTDPTMLGGGSQSTISRSNTMSRDISTVEQPSLYSPAGSQSGQNFWPPPPTTSTLLSATPTPQSPYFPAGSYHQQRSVSYAPSQTSFNANAGALSAQDGTSETEEEPDEVPELGTRGQSSATWRDEVARSINGSHVSEHDADIRSGVAASEHHDDNDDDDDEDVDEDDSNEDVEYTLKDRQDAINIEHPFGLPIWKPALYKKDRSVHRNADKELHLLPSIAAERHLWPGNLLWALLFGWWMALVCMIFAVLMCLVPFGGVKYGRVIWELGGYLFWPFGRYVERVEEDAADAVKGYDELTDDEEDTVYDDPRVRDVEDAGKTWAKQSGRSTSSAGTVKKVRGRVDFEGLFENSLAPDQSSNPSGSSPSEATKLLQRQSGRSQTYGTTSDSLAPQVTPSSSETEVAEQSPKPNRRSDEDAEAARRRHFRIRASGRLSYWLVFYLIVAPMMMIVCILCWFFVFTIPMAKLLWILVRDLGREPLALHFRAPSPNYAGNNAEPNGGANGSGLPHLEAGQRAPRHSRKTYDKSRAMGRFLGPNSTIILCTYKAMGLKYYKYTVDGTNIIFINLLPMIGFVIFDFFVIAPIVDRHHLGGFLGFIAAKGTMFMLSLLGVIPLSYFIGMGVASISAQSSIGMGAVINATFGSVIEIILYSIALSQAKGQLVEGSIVGSLLAGVLLMPGLSMIAGAVRRKEQRFNARSAGVTSTMLIMAIIGILTPTLFYEIYGTFQLTCTACPDPTSRDNFTCRRCFYEHVDPVDDEFYKSRVQALSFYCAVLLVLSYLIGLWFSLRTHASQIWQNQQHIPTPAPQSAAIAQLSHSAGLPASRMTLPHRSSVYKRLPQNMGQLLTGQRQSAINTHTGDVSFSGSGKGSMPRNERSSTHLGISHESTPRTAGHQDNLQAITGYTADEVNRAFEVVAATASALQSQQEVQPAAPAQQPQGLPRSFSAGNNLSLGHMSTPTPTLRRQASHMHNREISKGGTAEDSGGGGHGGHDAPNWSRFKSYSVLFGCTVLYAIIAEILVDVVDVVLEGSGIPEKFLGITLFALVPNVTEFMNAISFALNGNIALSMEIGSAYALQVCLLQIPAMIAFTYFYGRGKESMAHHAFTLVFPRWDVIAIMFAVFLLTYTYIEARSNYYRGSILVISYLVLLGGFYMAPPGMDTSDDPLLFSTSILESSKGLLNYVSMVLSIAWNTLFSR